MPTESPSPVSQTDLEPEIAHLLLIDIVGYSKLLVNEQIEAVQELNRVVRGTECFRKAEADGKLLRVPTGDGMILLFSNSPEQPIRCALEIAEQLKERPQVQVRMGIHSGPANQIRDVNDTINVAGPGINVAQRVMDCGDAGHILLSKHIADDLAQYRHWQPYLRDLGEFEVKHGLRLGIVNLYKDNLGNPSLPEKLQRRKRRRQSASAIVKPVRSRWWILTGVLVWSLIALAIAMSIYVGYDRLKRSRPGAIPAPEKSIAVLPFENRSEEKANAYFAEGIQDEILTRLSKIADLKVISRTSTQQYQTSAGNIREIAKQLGVAHIVEGSVQKNGDAVRVNVQLINAAADSHLWSETFDRKLTDIFSVESEIAKSIADHLRAELTGREEKVVSSKPTDDAEAYDAYLRGLAYTLKAGNTSTNARAAQKYFKQAVERDAKFALAWALLSYNDARGYITSNLDPTVVLQEEAQRAAETALSLQPDLGEALFAKGFYHYACLKDYDTAARYFEQARQLLPNSSRIPESLAYVARRRGDWVRSESYFNEAELLDPRNVNLLTSHAHSYIALRRFSDATHKLDQILDITPDDPDTLVTEVAIAQAEGNLPRAAAILGRIQDVPSAWHVQAYQIVLERVRSPALSRLKKGIETSGEKSNGDSRFWLGWAEKACGDNAAAEQTWQQARAELESSLSEQPENAGLIAHLALTNIGLGNKAAALALSERALGVVPIEKDALVGGMPLEIVARATAQGAPARAITVLEKLLSIPYAGPLPENIPLTRALLRLDPMFDSLRQNPKFEQLLASAGRNQ